jgi:hypothetical protein
VKVPSVLLLCDRFNPKWQVWVDGKQEKLLRCNFIERGVFLQPGKHDVEFRFVSPNGPLYVSFIAIAFGLLLCGWLAVAGSGPGEEQPNQASTASPSKDKSSKGEVSGNLPQK